jgi:hypothetical protein
MRLIGWSVRSGDGLCREPGAVVRRVLSRAVPGGIILMHEGRSQSIESILRTVDELRALGFSFAIPKDAQLR